MAVDFTQEISDLRTTMSSVRDVTDLPALEAQIADLEQQSAAPDLWDDQEKAQQVTSALSRAKAEHDRIVGMDQRIEDLEVLVQMGQEEGGDDGADVLAEAEAELTKLRKAVGELEVRTLLSGEYDEREAVVTIRAGTGGVDATTGAQSSLATCGETPASSSTSATRTPLHQALPIRSPPTSLLTQLRVIHDSVSCRPTRSS